MKITRKLITGILVTLGLAYTGVYFAPTIYLNHAAEPMDESEYPEEAFQDLYNEVDVDKKHNLKVNELNNDNFQDRLQLLGSMYIDSAISMSKTFRFESNRTKSPLIGSEASTCYTDARSSKRPNSDETNCKPERTEKIPQATQTTYSDLKLVSIQEGLLPLFKNDTIIEEFNNWAKRAQYYDDKLEPREFKWRPLEFIFYDYSGLHIIGQNLNKVLVNNKTYRPESKGVWNYINTSLEPGKHKISHGNQSVEFKVHPRKPEIATVNKRTIIGKYRTNSSHRFEKAVFHSEGESKKIELDGERVNITELNRSRYRFVTFVSDQVNFTEYYRQDGSTSLKDNPLYREGTGLSRVEARIGLKLLKISKKLTPFKLDQRAH